MPLIRADSLNARRFAYAGMVSALAALVWVPWSRDIPGFGISSSGSVIFILALGALATFAALLVERTSHDGATLEGLLHDAGRRLNMAVALVLAVICGCMTAGSLDGHAIVVFQAGAVWRWMILRDPFNFLAFGLYGWAILAIFRGPLDARLPTVKLAQGCAMLAFAALATTLWLGGWYDPLGVLAKAPATAWVNLAGVVIFVVKCVLLIGAQLGLRRAFTFACARWDVCHSTPYESIVLAVAALNLLMGAIYAWLVEPLAEFQRFMHGALTLVGCVALFVAAGIIGWTVLMGRSGHSSDAGHP